MIFFCEWVYQRFRVHMLIFPALHCTHNPALSLAYPFRIGMLAAAPLAQTSVQKDY